jgi:lysophospholipase L1-like esterase
MLALGSFLTAIVLGEFVCRFGFEPPARTDAFSGTNLGGNAGELLRPHPTRFFEPQPDRGGLIATDARSIRGGEHPPHHDRMLRVLVVGDSVTMGYSVHYGDSFVAACERRLRAALPELDIDVVALACTGYSTHQNRIDLVERGIPLEPDLVVLALTGWNDSGAAVLRDDAAWARRHEQDSAFDRSFVGSSRLATMAREMMRNAFSPSVAQAAKEVGKQSWPYGERVPPDAFRENVDAMIEAARAANAAPFVMLLPQRGENETAPRVTARLDAAAALAGECKVPLLDARAAFAPPFAAWFFDSIHPIEAGQRLLGAKLAQCLLDDPKLALAQRATAVKSNDAAPSITAAQPREFSALVGGMLIARVTTIDPAPRFFLGGTPLRIAKSSAGVFELQIPPLPEGELTLEVTTRHGSASFPHPIRAHGATIEALAAGRIKATIRGPVGARVSLFGSEREKPVALPYGRTQLIDTDSMIDFEVHGTIGADGTYVVETARMPSVSSDTIVLQAQLDVKSGDPPHFPAYTNAVVVPVKAR